MTHRQMLVYFLIPVFPDDVVFFQVRDLIWNLMARGDAR